ncbi:sterol carrier family protein [Schaalia turicensis]|uniref:sterol carrier family protein n=1 Tax=Schaalia turicensis TaxID=131111 RepID=UPI003693E8D1
MTRKIDSADALPLLTRFRAGEELSAGESRTAVRFLLEELADRHPGHAVEIRVPYVGAVQAVAGVRHRRGTPPNVVECDAATFLGLCVGTLGWDDAVASGRVDASGTRANLSEFLPLVHVAGAGRRVEDVDRLREPHEPHKLQ